MQRIRRSMPQIVRDSRDDYNDFHLDVDPDVVLSVEDINPSPVLSISRATTRHFLFALFVVTLVAATLLVFAQVTEAMRWPQTSNITAQIAPIPDIRVSGLANVTVARAQMHYYPTEDPRASLMQPVIDSKGYLWFGAMRANKLARLDPATGKVREWDPPGARHGLMMTAVGPDDSIWFAEENGGFIGRFDQATERFIIFPLPRYNGGSPEPEHLLFDREGRLWFTLNRSGQIARMDPETGTIRTWKVLSPEGDRAPRPYSLALAPDGKVWFGAALYGGLVGSLNPKTGEVTIRRLDNSTAQITSMVSDRNGYIWFTELQFNRLGRINTRTGEVIELMIPEPVGATTGNYALDVGPDGAVWITSFDANAIIRYSQISGEYTFYTLLIPDSVPFGLVIAPDGSAWFTSDGAPNDYIGHLFP